MSTGRYNTAVILLNMGGPGTLDDIPEYLYNIFSDRSIIKLPGGKIMQKPLAKLISRMRNKKVIANYRLIGGGSPLLKWSTAQSEYLENILNKSDNDYKCFLAMRYFHPYIEETIGEAINSGYNRLILLPLYPQYSTATTGSSFIEVQTVLSNHDGVEAVYINDYHDNDSYISLLSEYIESNIAENEYLLFSAHSLPQKFVDDGDPYVDQIKRTAKLAAGNREYSVSFQSRNGPVDWVGPDTVDEVKRLLSESNQTVFVVPISFVSDHIETLYEIDIELKKLVGDPLSSRIKRMPMFNDDRRFAKILAEIIIESTVANARP